MLAEADDVEIVGEAADGADALAQAVELRPDVVLMDLHMPALNGVEATRRLGDAAPDLAVLVLTMFDDDESVLRRHAGRRSGISVKGAAGTRSSRAVRAVAAGRGDLRRRRRRPRDRRPSPRTGAARAPPAPSPSLTDREREILDLIAAGRSNTEIARKLVLSDKTVRNHVSNIFVKLQVADRAQAIVRAREAGLGGVSPAPGGTGSA